MNKILTTASIITSGIIVGAIVKKYLPSSNSVKKALKDISPKRDAKLIFSNSALEEDVNEFFV